MAEHQNFSGSNEETRQEATPPNILQAFFTEFDFFFRGWLITRLNMQPQQARRLTEEMLRKLQAVQ